MAFVLVGIMASTAGGPFKGSPIYSHGDIDFAINAARNEVDAYFTSSGLSHSRRSGGISSSFIDGWSVTPSSGSNPIPQIASGSPSWMADHIDACGIFFHEALGRWFIYFQADPGTLPAGEGNTGAISSVGAAWTDDADALSRTWTVHGTEVATATNWAEQGFVASIEGPVTTYAGGISELSPVWLPNLQRAALFSNGLTWPGSGSYRWRMIRRLETLPSGPGSGSGLAWDSPTMVFDPFAETPSGYPGYETHGAHHFRVKRDPWTGRLHCTYKHGIGTADDGLYHAWSDDDGANWTIDPNNPLVRVTDWVVAAEGLGLVGPGTHPSAVNDYTNGPSLVFDPSSPTVWLVAAGAPRKVYADNDTHFFVWQGTRADLGSSMAMMTPAATILDAAPFVDLVAQDTVLQDPTPAASIIHTAGLRGSPDRFVRRWRLRWPIARRSDFVAVREHYRTNRAAGGVPFVFRPKGGSTTYLAAYARAPQAKRATHNRYDVTVELEERTVTD